MNNFQNQPIRKETVKIFSNQKSSNSNNYQIVDKVVLVSVPQNEMLTYILQIIDNEIQSLQEYYNIFSEVPQAFWCSKKIQLHIEDLRKIEARAAAKHTDVISLVKNYLELKRSVNVTQQKMNVFLKSVIKVTFATNNVFENLFQNVHNTIEHELNVSNDLGQTINDLKVTKVGVNNSATSHLLQADAELGYFRQPLPDVPANISSLPYDLTISESSKSQESKTNKLSVILKRVNNIAEEMHVQQNDLRDIQNRASRHKTEVIKLLNDKVNCLQKLVIREQKKARRRWCLGSEFINIDVNVFASLANRTQQIELKQDIDKYKEDIKVLHHIKTQSLTHNQKEIDKLIHTTSNLKKVIQQSVVNYTNTIDENMTQKNRRKRQEHLNSIDVYDQAITLILKQVELFGNGGKNDTELRKVLNESKRELYTLQTRLQQTKLALLRTHKSLKEEAESNEIFDSDAYFRDVYETLSNILYVLQRLDLDNTTASFTSEINKELYGNYVKIAKNVLTLERANVKTIQNNIDKFEEDSEARGYTSVPFPALLLFKYVLNLCDKELTSLHTSLHTFNLSDDKIHHQLIKSGIGFLKYIRLKSSTDNTIVKCFSVTLDRLSLKLANAPPQTVKKPSAVICSLMKTISDDIVKSCINEQTLTMLETLCINFNDGNNQLLTLDSVKNFFSQLRVQCIPKSIMTIDDKVTQNENKYLKQQLPALKQQIFTYLEYINVKTNLLQNLKLEINLDTNALEELQNLKVETKISKYELLRNAKECNTELVKHQEDLTRAESNTQISNDSLRKIISQSSNAISNANIFTTTIRIVIESTLISYIVDVQKSLGEKSDTIKTLMANIETWNSIIDPLFKKLEQPSKVSQVFNLFSSSKSTKDKLDKITDHITEIRTQLEQRNKDIHEKNDLVISLTSSNDELKKTLESKDQVLTEISRKLENQFHAYQKLQLDFETQSQRLENRTEEYKAHVTNLQEQQVLIQRFSKNFSSTIGDGSDKLLNQLKSISSDVTICCRKVAIDDLAGKVKAAYIEKSIALVKKFEREAASYEDRIIKFRGTSNDVVYLDVIEMLARCVTNLDNIRSKNFNDVIEARRNAISYVTNLQTLLESKVSKRC